VGCISGKFSCFLDKVTSGSQLAFLFFGFSCSSDYLCGR
jgi:hypothetical protein